MANELKMAIVESILLLRALQWSARRIARELNLDRGTVRNYLKRAEGAAKPANPPAGSGGSKPATYPPVPGGAETEDGSVDPAARDGDAKPAISMREKAGLPEAEGEASPATVANLPGSLRRGRPSECVPYQALIVEKLEQGLSAQRIYQDLVGE